MATFNECLEYAFQNSGLNIPEGFILKEKQTQTLKSIHNSKDCIAILPTGYGKNLIFQLLPWFLQRKHNHSSPMIVIVVSPLSSLMQDQMLALRKQGIKACCVNIGGTYGVTFEEVEDMEESEVVCDVPFHQVENCEFNFIYSHPETFSRKKFGSLLRGKLYQKNVCAVVIDEVHMVSEWGEQFRPDFKKVGELTCICESAVHLALTATATVSLVKELEKLLNYDNPDIVWANPDRANIYLQIEKRLPNIKKFEKYDDLIMPIANELKEKLTDFPLTILYVESLECLGYFYQYLANEMKEMQFCGAPIPQNRLFAQYHKDYPNTMKQFIISELVKQQSKSRLVLATVALGMGLNAPCIQRIIHCRPPTTMEKYMQEIGRAGRNGQDSEAIMYYNMSDVAKSRKGFTNAMWEFCLLDNKCYRKELLNYFGFSSMVFSGNKRNCCSYCRSTCK